MSPSRTLLNSGTLLALFLLLVMGTAPSYAGVITYEEILEDENAPFVYVDVLQNLTRTRTLGDGSPPNVQVVDAFIAPLLFNHVSDSFGVWVHEPITYTHVFQPVGTVDSFLLVSLGILASSVSGTPEPGTPLIDFFELLFGIGTPDDTIVVDNQPIGFLTPGRPLEETAFQFSTGDTALIALLLEDNNRVRVTITPAGPGPIAEPDGDKVRVRSSTFQVTYQTQAVPEPGTMTLLVAGLLAAGLRSKARRRQVRLR